MGPDQWKISTKKYKFLLISTSIPKKLFTLSKKRLQRKMIQQRRKKRKKMPTPMLLILIYRLK